MTNEWKVQCLGELANKIAMGPFGSNIKVETFKNSGVPIISGQHLHGFRLFDNDFNYISEEHAKKLSNSNVFRHDVIFTHAGTIGQVSYIPENSAYEKYVISQRQFYLRCDRNKLDYKFITYYFKSPYGQYLIDSNTNQTGVPSISRPATFLKTTKIRIPFLPEQKAIASVLSSLDDKIDLLHRQNKTLEALAFFDHLRVPLSKMERDKRKTGKLYPYYGAAKVMDYINDYIFEGDYILLGEDGTVRTEEGFPILQYATGKFWVNNHTHVIKAKKPYSNFFIWNYLKKKNIDEIVTGAVQPKINQGNLKSLDFPNYPKDLVENFNCQTEPLFKKINQNNTQIRTLEKLRDTLLPKLMSGEVRVEYEH